MIVADARETKSIKALQQKECKVEKEFLEVGDYLLSNNICIERKTGRDLLNSISDKRLYTQLNNICQYDNPILAIITDNIWRDFYFTKTNYIHNVFTGTLVTIIAKYPKVKILNFENENSFIEFMIKLDSKLSEDGSKERPEPITRKAVTVDEERENNLASIKGVGITMSKKLLKKYKSINQIANSSVDDLTNIDRLGKKTASHILEVLN